MSSIPADLKPLYLDGARPLTVVLDGPALKVTAPARAISRYPLRRLSRVVVSGRVDWSTPALIACLRAGIVVTFLDDDGELVGLCLGAATSGINLHERLADFALRPDWPVYYTNWYNAMERRQILRLLKRLSMRVEDLRPATVRQALAKRLGARTSSHTTQRTLGYLEAAVAACAARTANDSGIPIGLLTDARQGIDLTRDLGRLAAWPARILAAQLLVGNWPRGAPTRADLALAVERRHSQFVRQTRECLTYLERTATALNYGNED